MTPVAATPGAGTAGLIGRSVPRKEDRPLLTGSARFVDDLHGPGTAQAAILRSPHAHARIAAIRAADALRLPGVVDVLTSADLPAGGPLIPMRMYGLPGMERFLQRPLACDVVRYAGEPVAVVVAESRYLAEDALELMEASYEPLEPVLDADAACGADAVRLHPQAGTNVAGSFVVEHGDIDAALADADVVVEGAFACGRHGAVPLETRGLRAEVAPDGQLTVWGAAKVVHVNRRMLADLLGWPEERIRFVEPHVGGGFGARGEFYPEDYLIPLCAIRLGRPVAWTEDREEHLRACNHSRQQLHRIAVALRGDGTFLGLRDDFVMDTGAYVRTHGSVVPGLTAGLLPGPYRWPAYRCVARQVLTSKTPAGTYRAPGRYEANFARERIVDVAARRLGRDPADLRRQNLVVPDEMPYASGARTEGHPVVYDSGDYPALLERGLARFDYEEMQRWRQRGDDAHRRRGVGLGLFVEKSGIGLWEYARVEIDARGRPVLHTGVASLGQGVDTVLAQICAETLGVRYEDVVVRHGDTADVPDGMGAFGSRASMLGGAAVLRAATALRERLLGRAADLLEAAPEDLELGPDGVTVRGAPASALSLQDLARAGRPAEALARGDEPGASAEAWFNSEQMSFPYGLHCVAVEVDVETGGVEIARYVVAYDVGRALNPRLVEGQIVGGVVQGIGGALLEELAYDRDGQLVAGTFMDYLLPTAGEAPAVEVIVSEDSPTPLSPLGAKGAGEGGTAAAGAAIANAVSDALGAEVTTLPLTPERVVALAREGGAR